MAEHMPPDLRRCSLFFLYDGSKVREEEDPTRKGICYFYPEETPIDKQELLCGQLAGAGRCVSELSSSPVKVLRLHRNTFAIRMKDDFFWALGCSSVDVPTVSVSELLDELISLFCFYNGSVRRSYQLQRRETLTARWAQYLSHHQQGFTDLHHIFSSIKTIDSTNVDPLLLLKAALILQACQRCPLVLAGCILFKGRVVSTQMTPALTMKVMVHESDTFIKSQRHSGASGSSPPAEPLSSVPVFLTSSELHYLQSAPVDKKIEAHSTPCKESQPRKPRLSRTLSDTFSNDSEPSDPGSSQSPLKNSCSPCKSSSDNVFSPGDADQLLSSNSPLPNGKIEEEEADSFYHSFHTNGGDVTDGSMNSSGPEANCINGGTGGNCRPMLDFREAGGTECVEGLRRGSDCMLPSGGDTGAQDDSLVPMTLYLHRVKGLVLALLVEMHFLNDSDSMEEVYHSSLAALNGLEAHLKSVTPGPPGAQGPYIFAHFDSIQSTLTSNLSGRPGAGHERPFVRATSLLHSHFCNTETLQEAIIRSAGAAVFGTRSVAQETYFLQHGGSVRNSGIPSHQDTAFALPTKARHRLLKHGVNLL
ncbi:BLOC-3 complex member HPS4 [Eucyclogobius newberryi]|uniref:BLOC-3 complex member HPS4 n=1 Tax=Eucyclogobius newberryi TaxID=166745 RepID=UPI003B5AE8D8